MEMRDFWDQHRGERVIVTFNGGTTIEGFVQEVIAGMLVLGVVPTPTDGQKRYVPWPNSNVAFIECRPIRT